MQRILIVGLDGASPHLVEKWQGDLPTLSHLMAEGSRGILQSTIPPRSVPAWYCFATGMNPAKFGIFGFSQRRPGTYDYTFANFSFCQAPPFWEWLNRRGITTGVVHMPGTFPPRPVQGFLLSGWPAPLNRGNLVYTHPPDLSRDIDRSLGQPFEFLSPKPIDRDNDAEVLAERFRILQMHGDVACQFLNDQSWQVALVVLSPVDRASHQFWRHMDPTHPQHDPALAAQFGEALKEVYQASDVQVGRLLSLLDEGDWIFIVSDHGFGPTDRTFYLNEWLQEQGYLVLKDEKELGRVSWRTRLLGRLTAPLFRLNQASPIFRRLAEPFKKRAFSTFLRDEYVRAKQQGLVRLNHLPVDWSRTRAYSPDEAALYLNLQGRDPEGVVEPGEQAQHLLAEIEEGLHHIPDPSTGRPVNVRLYRKEKVYSGPFIKQAPDLIVTMDDYQTEVMAELGFESLFNFNPVRSGTHTPEGILIAKGPGIPAGQQLDAGLMDIAPTVLHLSRVPVPDEADGQVLLDLFEENAEPRLRPVVAEPTEAGGEEEIAYTEAELRQVEKQLRDLGYLE